MTYFQQNDFRAIDTIQCQMWSYFLSTDTIRGQMKFCLIFNWYNLMTNEILFYFDLMWLEGKWGPRLL